MDCNEYQISMLTHNDIIMIDTSSVMDYISLEHMINTLKPIILELNKKIIVPKVVRMELMRHCYSNNPEKKEKAKQALQIINSNLDVFLLDCSDMENEDIYNAFADAELLSELTRNKPKHRQLLITNDKRLSTDAFKLNKQESCYGGYISVCYVTNEGYLNKSKIVSETHEQKTIVKEVIKEVPVEVSVTDNENTNDSKHTWIIIGASASAFGLGCFFGKYGNKILTTISKAF